MTLWARILDFLESCYNFARGKGFFSSWHVWDFKNAHAQFCIPRLRAFKDLVESGHNVGCPDIAEEYNLKTDEEIQEKWIYILDCIIFYFDYNQDPSPDESSMTKSEIDEKLVSGRKFFADYFDIVWD